MSRHDITAPGIAMRPDIDSLVPATAPLARRGFLAGSLAGGFAAAVAPTGALLAQTIATPADGLQAGVVSIPSAGGVIPVYRAQPADRKRLATVLVVHEAFGVHEHIRDVCRRFARAGYQALAPDLFVRQGDVSRLSTTAEIFQNVISKVPDEQVMGDLDACARWAAANGGDDGRLAITGFCWGGRIVWLYAAHGPRVKAGVAWYGRLTGMTSAANPTHPYDVAEKLRAPVLGLYAGQDDGIPLSTVDEMKTRLSFGEAASVASEFVIYPQAPHAFHADYRPSYRPEAARDAWTRCIGWFATHGAAARP